MYQTFTRNWWKMRENGQLEPAPRARKTYYSKVNTEEQARKLCKEYNSTHRPGKLSRKMEYQQI